MGQGGKDCIVFVHMPLQQNGNKKLNHSMQIPLEILLDSSTWSLYSQESNFHNACPQICCPNPCLFYDHPKSELSSHRSIAQRIFL